MTERPAPQYSDPLELAASAARAARPLLIATDVDGTIAEITPTPEASVLRPGAIEALRRIRRAGHDVAVLSGRSMRELRGQFALTDEFVLVGSHGAETGQPVAPTTREVAVLAAVEDILERAAARAPGARLERKPFAVALHVRRADQAAGDEALATARAELDGAQALTLLEGHRVLEVSVRPTSKASAMADIRRTLRPATVVFVGDDRSDEGVFSVMQQDDLAVKVGPDETVAAHRLQSPADVVVMLQALADAVSPDVP
jgi:trehalose 6-phosphate phosphatase